MIYVVCTSIKGGWLYPRWYRTSAEAARRDVADWVASQNRAGQATPSMSGMSAFDEIDFIQVHNLEEGV